MIVQSSDLCELYGLAAKAFVESGASAWLCLFTNNFQPGPDTQNPSSYVEANYAGYARWATLTSWTGPFRDGPGLYHIQSGPWTFNINTGPTTQATYGWFLLRETRVLCAERFAGAPIMVAFGQPGPTVLAHLTQASQWVVCPDA